MNNPHHANHTLALKNIEADFKFLTSISAALAQLSRQEWLGDREQFPQDCQNTLQDLQATCSNVLSAMEELRRLADAGGQEERQATPRLRTELSSAFRHASRQCAMLLGKLGAFNFDVAEMYKAQDLENEEKESYQPERLPRAEHIEKAKEILQPNREMYDSFIDAGESMGDGQTAQEPDVPSGVEFALTGMLEQWIDGFTDAQIVNSDYLKDIAGFNRIAQASGIPRQAKLDTALFATGLIIRFARSLEEQIATRIGYMEGGVGR
jgi:hypothetical protein